MTDSRIAPVEDNLLAFFAAAGGAAVLRRDADDDVTAIRSDVPFPLFNVVSGARFGAEAATRAGELADSYVAAGLPWMWWLTPSTTSIAIEDVLEARGLARGDVPGMYCDLEGTPAGRELPGVSLSARPDDSAFIDVMLGGFGIPELFREPLTVVMEQFPDVINVLASLDGRPVACGTAYLTGATAGLYNIATLEEARGRGIGYALTVELMARSRSAGATHAVLHASESGRAVYERAGFAEVCAVPQYVWAPPGIDAT